MTARQLIVALLGFDNLDLSVKVGAGALRSEEVRDVTVVMRKDDAGMLRPQYIVVSGGKC